MQVAAAGGVYTPELEGEVQPLPTEEVVDKVAEEHGQVPGRRWLGGGDPPPDHLEHSPGLTGVTPVVGVHLRQQSGPGGAV